MKTVYGVSSGSYSDYSVHFICETEELAVEVERKSNLYHSFIEEFNLIESPSEYFSSAIYHVVVDGEGKELSRNTYSQMMFSNELGYSNSWGTGGGANVTAISYKNYDHALKAARDKLMQRKARGAGLS